WSANLLIVNHALFMTDLAIRSENSGFSLLPKYDVAIFDEAHTLEAVAGEHLGLQLSNVGIDIALSRMYNDRTRKGLLAFYGLQEAMDLGVAARAAAGDFFDEIALWFERHGDNFNGRVRSKLDLTDGLAEILRELARAIFEGAAKVEKADHRIELSAASD